MPIESELVMKISSNWSEMTRVNEAVENFFAALEVPEDEQLRHTMIACELVENGIKYGRFTQGHHMVVLHLKASEEYVTVQVSNPISERSREYLGELDRTIQWTRGFQDPFEAYVERVKAISGEPLEMSKSCLGIARIAYEGKAALDFYLEDDGTLSVSAVSAAL